jgi:protein arginine kinase activator
MSQTKCDFCQQKRARSRITQIDNGQVQTFYACRECAIEQNMAGMLSFSIEHEAAAMAPPETVVQSEPAACCPNCGLSYNSFRESGKFGCSECYDAFKDPLFKLMNQIQAGEEHCGKVPQRIRKTLAYEKEISELRGELAAAVRIEDFAKAAQLRDKVHALVAKKEEALLASIVVPQDAKDENDSQGEPGDDSAG